MDIFQEKIDAKLHELSALEGARFDVIRTLIDLGREQGRSEKTTEGARRPEEKASPGPGPQCEASGSEEKPPSPEELAEAVFRMGNSLRIVRNSLRRLTAQQSLQEDRGLLLAAGVMVLGAGVAISHR
jgi:hypothetical protein